MQGAEWSMETKIVSTWYPGNGEEGTQQILGPRELPSKWQGDWRRTMMSRTPSKYTDENGSDSVIVNPAILRDIFETIARGGKRIRVTWSVTGDVSTANGGFAPDDNNGRIVREGRMSRLSFHHIRLQDINWEIEFEWVSRGAVSLPVTTVRSNSVNSDSASYQAAIQALVDANNAAHAQALLPSRFSLGDLESIANYPSSVVNSLDRSIRQISTDVTSVISIANTLASQPVQVRNRAVALAKQTVASMNSFKDQISQIPAELKSNKHGASDVIKASILFAKQSDAADAASRSGQEFALKLQREVQARNNAGTGDPKNLGASQNAERVHVTKFGETPQTVSMKYYNSPDHAVDILRANRLSWYVATFTPGKVLIIPALNGLEATRNA